MLEAFASKILTYSREGSGRGHVSVPLYAPGKDLLFIYD